MRNGKFSFMGPSFIDALCCMKPLSTSLCHCLAAIHYRFSLIYFLILQIHYFVGHVLVWGLHKGTIVVQGFIVS